MKRRIRKHMASRLSRIPPEAAADKSRAACAELVNLPEFATAETVMIYLSVSAEPDTAAIAETAWQKGKAVLVPKTTWERRHMEAVEIHSLTEGLLQTPIGLHEPTSGAATPPELIDLVVVPALVFDRQGNRLGRGAGFYDRFLARLSIRATVCGLGFAEQLVDDLPTDRHDYPMHMLVTDREVLRFRRRGRSIQEQQGLHGTEAVDVQES